MVVPREHLPAGFGDLGFVLRPIWTLDRKAEFVRPFQVRSLDTTLIFDRTGQLVSP